MSTAGLARSKVRDSARAEVTLIERWASLGEWARQEAWRTLTREHRRCVAQAFGTEEEKR